MRLADAHATTGLALAWRAAGDVPADDRVRGLAHAVAGEGWRHGGSSAAKAQVDADPAGHAEQAGEETERHDRRTARERGHAQAQTAGESTTASNASAKKLHTHLAAADDLLDGYAATASEAGGVVADSQASLERQLQAARVMVVVLALLLASGQTLPLAAGWLLLRPERLAVLVAQD